MVELMLRFSQASGRFAIEALVRSALVIAAVMAADLLLRRSSPRLRHRLLLFGVAAGLLVAARPIAMVSAAERSAAVVPAVKGEDFAQPADAARDRHEAAAVVPPPSATVPAPIPSPAAVRLVVPGAFLALVGALWALVAVLLFGHRTIGAVAARRAAARSSPLAPADRAIVARLGRSLGLEVVPDLRLSEDLGPAVVGWIRPRIVFPRRLFVELPPPVRDSLIAHELTHVRRGDPWTHAAVRFVTAILWMNPLVWVLARRVEREQERACDEVVVESGVDRADYAEGLLRVVATTPGRLGLAPGAAHRRGDRTLVRRFEDILDGSGRRRPELVRIALVAVLSFGGVVGAGATAADLVARDQDSAPTSAGRKSSSEAAAIRKGLAWLLANQAKDGSWKSPGDRVNEGVTALALRAFLDAAPTERPDGSDQAVARAAAYLIAAQTTDGLIGKPNVHSANHGHAQALEVLATYAATADSPELRSALKKAVLYAEEAKNPYKGWRYGKKPGDNDACNTGEMLLGLYAARSRGISAAKSVETDGLAFLAALTDEETGRTGYVVRGSLVVRPEGLVEKFPPQESEAITALSVLVRLTLGAKPEDSCLRKGVTLILAKKPRWDVAAGAIDAFYWYYGVRALRAYGGPESKDWLKAMRSMAVEQQRTSGTDAGSWEPIDAWSDDSGPVYMTALMLSALSLAR